MIRLVDLIPISNGLQYHLNNNIPLTENVYRYSSDRFVELYGECRKLYEEGKIILEGLDLEIIEQTDLGLYGYYNEEKVPLDLPMLNEALYRKGQYVQLEIPRKRKDGKPGYVVYVRNPRTKKVNKVKFGSALGGWSDLETELSDPEVRARFSKKLECPKQWDKKTPMYWTCRLPQYWHWLGGSKNYTGFW